MLIDNQSVMADVCYSESTDLSSGSFHLDPDSKEPVVTWIIRDQEPAFQCYSGNQINAKLDLRSIYRIVAGNYGIEYNNNKYSLLIGGDETDLTLENIVGWVSHDALMFNKNPLVNRDTSIYVKALIREGDVNNGKGLRIFKTPELKDSDEAIEVRTIFFVYDFYPHSGGTPGAPIQKAF
ncbi:MAG: hypothetical protein R2861_17295 [Desulfobacterales bacterium]